MFWTKIRVLIRSVLFSLNVNNFSRIFRAFFQPKAIKQFVQWYDEKKKEKAAEKSADVEAIFPQGLGFGGHGGQSRGQGGQTKGRGGYQGGFGGRGRGKSHRGGGSNSRGKGYDRDYDRGYDRSYDGGRRRW